MSDYNRWTGTGHLTKKPETKNLPSGSVVTECAVAVNKSWKDKNTGEWAEKVTFVEFRQFGERGEALVDRFDKGMHVLVEGDLEIVTWEDKTTGDKKSKPVVNAAKILKMGKKGGDSNGEPTSKPAPKPKKDDDVPF